jgi:hypothetical protein
MTKHYVVLVLRQARLACYNHDDIALNRDAAATTIAQTTLACSQPTVAYYH